MDELHKAILAEMERQVIRIVDEEAKLAAARTEERVRGMAGEIATKVATWVDFNIFAQRLVITVQLPEKHP